MPHHLFMLALTLPTSTGITRFVWLWAGVGLICGLYAIITICKELAQLKAWREEEKKDSHSDLEAYKTWLNNWAQKHNGTHLAKRLLCILTALGYSTTTENKGGDKKLPTLRDLHDMTLQTELSRVPSLLLRMVVSSLLIIGIIGTLVGVHNGIGEVTGNLSVLKPALEPSIWAVGSTVLLLLLRGIYVGRVDRYISLLDTLTLNRLYAKLQPASNLSHSITALSGKVDTFGSSGKQMEKATSRIANAAQGLETCADKLGSCGDKLLTLTHDAEKELKALSLLNKRQFELCNTASTILQAAQGNQLKLNEDAHTLHSLVEQWSGMTRSVAEAVEVFGSIKALREGLPALMEQTKTQQQLTQTLSNAADSAEKRLGSLQALHHELTGLVTQTGHQTQQVSQSYAEVEEHLRNIIDERNTITTKLGELTKSMIDHSRTLNITADSCISAVKGLRSVAGSINNKEVA